MLISNKQKQSANPRLPAMTVKPIDKHQQRKIMDARRKSAKSEIMDQNIRKFERKLKDFEQMFEYISPDLDFSKLD